MKVLKEHLMLMMVLLVGFVGFAQAQYSRVTGTVTDDKGAPLPGVSVVINGTTKGVATDFDGKYTLTEVARGAVLEFSSVGYKTLDLKVTGEQLNVKLSEVAQDLDEIVVVGYGTQKRGDVTTAITSVKTQDLFKGVLGVSKECNLVVLQVQAWQCASVGIPLSALLTTLYM